MADRPDALDAALKATAQAVNERLEMVLPKISGPESRLLEAMRYATLGGGKRLRPLLVLASAELFKVSRQSALQVATAIELVHCYSLVHDDLPAMDDDDLRRGQPTVHKKYDEATAILAGDALLTKAFEMLTDESVHADPRVRIELIAQLAKASGAGGMVAGQAIDIASENEHMDLGAITRLQQLKTGALISFSAESGAIMGKASQHQRQCLRGYAHDMGLAFQIIDDLLDVEGNAEQMGKATGKDALAGKATFVSLMGVERARNQAHMLMDQAMAHLNDFGEDATLLRAIAHFVISRDQ